MTEQIEISNAEWEVMRVIWTLGQATSRQVIDVMTKKKAWKEATTKTLLRRLVAKKALIAKKEKRAFIYEPLIAEQATINAQLAQNFANICQMHQGKTLAYLVDNLKLTKADIELLQQKLATKLPAAPLTLACDCIPSEVESVPAHDCCVHENDI